MSEKEHINITQIAQVCHEANRAYCATIGDLSQPSWEQAPEWQKTSVMQGVAFHIGELNAGLEASPSASHESWLIQKREGGWKYGPVKDPDKKEHPCFVPYEDLPVEQKLKNYIFCAIVTGFDRAGGDHDAE